MSELVLTLFPKDHSTLGAVRTLPSLRVAEYGGLLWLRGIATNETIDIRVKQLPVVQTYTIDEQHNLFVKDALTPTLNIKDLTWKPIAKYITIEVPTSAMPAKITGTFPAKLVPAAHPRESIALLTTFAQWKAYADTAPVVRLNALRFAVSQTGEALVMGSPLPALPGDSYWLRGQTLIPAGLDFDMTITAPLLEKRLAVPPQALILVKPDGAWHVLPDHAFAPATRSAVRLTENNLKDGL